MCWEQRQQEVCGHNEIFSVPPEMQKCSSGQCSKIVSYTSRPELCQECIHSYKITGRHKEINKRIQDWWDPIKRRWYSDWQYKRKKIGDRFSRHRLYWAERGQACSNFASYLQVDNLDPEPGTNPLYDEWMKTEKENQIVRWKWLIGHMGEDYDEHQLFRELFNDDEWIDKVGEAWKEVTLAAEVVFHADEAVKKLRPGDAEFYNASLQSFNANNMAKTAAMKFQLYFKLQTQLRIHRIADLLNVEATTKLACILPVAYPGEYPADIGIDWGELQRYDPDGHDPDVEGGDTIDWWLSGWHLLDLHARNKQKWFEDLIKELKPKCPYKRKLPNWNYPDDDGDWEMTDPSQRERSPKRVKTENSLDPTTRRIWKWRSKTAEYADPSDDPNTLWMNKKSFNLGDFQLTFANPEPENEFSDPDGSALRKVKPKGSNPLKRKRSASVNMYGIQVPAKAPALDYFERSAIQHVRVMDSINRSGLPKIKLPAQPGIRGYPMPVEGVLGCWRPKPRKPVPAATEGWTIKKAYSRPAAGARHRSPSEGSEGLDGMPPPCGAACESPDRAARPLDTLAEVLAWGKSDGIRF